MPQINIPMNGKASGWYVEFSIYDEIKDKMQRFRKRKGFSLCTTKEECMVVAQKLKKEYIEKLSNGWTPYEDTENVIWEDSLIYAEIKPKNKVLRESKKTVAYFTHKFLETKINTSPSSYKTYMSKLRALRNWLKEEKLHERDASLMTFDEAKLFMINLTSEKLKAAKTKNEYIRLFTELWEFIRKERQWMDNIWEDLPRYRKDTKPQRPLQESTIQKLKGPLEKRNPQLWLAAQFLYYCFIRPGELRQMKIKNLDLTSGKAILYSSFTKSRKTRVVDISDDFVNLLITKHKLDQYPDDYYIFTPDKEPGLIPVHANFFNKNFAKVRNALELSKDYKLYGFKHTGAVVAIRSGADIKEIQNQMGHSSLQITDEYLKSMVGYESEFFKKQMPTI